MCYFSCNRGLSYVGWFLTVARRALQHPSKLDTFIYTKYILAACLVSKLLPDEWPQHVSVMHLLQ